MPKATCGLPFAAKAAKPFCVRTNFGWQHLNRNAVSKQDMTSAIDGAHTTLTQKRFHLILTVEHSTDYERRVVLQHLAVDGAEADAVFVFFFAGGAVFHSGLSDCLISDHDLVVAKHLGLSLKESGLIVGLV